MWTLFALAQQNVTTQSAWDIWLGRLSIVVGVLLGIGILWARAKKGFHGTLTDIVDERVKRVEDALVAHTDAEAGLVRQQIDQALAPIVAGQNQLIGRMDGFSAERDGNVRIYNEELDRLKERVTTLEVAKS